LRKENAQDIAGKITGKQIEDNQLVEVARNQGLKKGQNLDQTNTDC